MPFGGLAPLPFRLGDSEHGGVNASEHARFCADMVAVDRTAPAFRFRFRLQITSGGTATITILSYAGKNGVGVQFAPLLEFDGTGFYLRLAAHTNARGFAVDVATHVAPQWFARVTNASIGRRVSCSIPEPYLLTFGPLTSSGQTHDYEVVVYGSQKHSRIGDYGGHLKKRNSDTEGNATFAWQWYEALKHSLGTAYTKSDTSVLSWELKAHARALGTSQRISEMLASSATPHGSDALLGRWATIQAVQQADLEKWRIRELCEAKYSDRLPATDTYISDGLRAILGSTFDDIAPNLGTISTPPEPTYWPGVKNGDGVYDLGSGVWSSIRSLVTVVVRQGALSDAELQDLMTREVESWLDLNLSATSSWQWTTSWPGGFRLGTSKLGFVSL